MRFAPGTSLPETCLLATAERQFAVRVRRSARARRMILRLDAASGEPVLTLPPHVPLKEGEAFLRRHSDWVEKRVGERPGNVRLEPGAEIPLRGEQWRIVSRPGRGLVRTALEGGERLILVPGDPRHAARRVSDFLRREARGDLQAACRHHAERLGVRFFKLSLRDTTSRWGSCSSRGTLSFSWRLVLAPPEVLGYVAAHEVAHLREMNHSPRFWRLVAELDPGYGPAKIWLKRNGAALQRIGRD